MAFACGTFPVWPTITMKRPPPCRRMCGATQRASSQGPTTLVWKCRSSTSVATSSMRPADVRAGIAHHDVDAAERLDDVARPARRRRRGLQMSATKPLRAGRASRPRRRACRARGRRSRSGSLPRASRCAIARPMPLVPPVISAVLPESPRSMAASTEHVAVIAAVDADRAAGGEVGAVGHQERDEVGDLLRPCRCGRADWRA